MEPEYRHHLGESFFLQPAEIVAEELLGKILVSRLTGETLAVRIVETEAYLHENDFASHSAPGITKRNRPMFEKGGILYVYKIYGIHHCINVVTGEKGIGSAVLIRAGEPVAGLGVMKENRKSADERTLCKGPANLAKSFGFNLSHNNLSFLDEKLFIANDKVSCFFSTVRSERIGITKSADLKLRFYIKNNEFVSGKK